MLHCAVCDDDQEVITALESMMIEYPADLDCAAFFDPLVLIEDVRSGKKFDLYILDIVMPQMTGIDLAREIRKTDSDCVIIFLTTSDEFHSEAFGVEALQYLDKPADKTTLYHTLDRALRYLGKQKEKILPLQTKDGIYALELNQIVYVESYKHTLTFHLKDGGKIATLDSSLPLKKLMETLGFPPFCAPYRGFIINLDYVDCLSKLQFSMTTGALIPIPQKQFSKVRRQYSDYLLTRYTKGEF